MKRDEVVFFEDIIENINLIEEIIFLELITPAYATMQC